jgi:poly(3-hydroxyalkanoate) synthetase
MYEPSGRQFSYAGFLWPALIAASASEIAATFAKQWVDLAVGPGREPATHEPAWATPNKIALELKTVRLRTFATEPEGMPILLCAPFALHGAAITDLAPGHSLVAALREAGLSRLFVTDWRSAQADMRDLGIDNYLADLNVLVDHLGGHVDLIGLCQGGWMALLYAARFPAKVGKLVLAGAPIDIAAGTSGLSAIAESSPIEVFHELVRIGDGRMLGRSMLRLWGPDFVGPDEARELLQTPEPLGSAHFTQLERVFQDWHSWTLDLPGRFYLEVVEKLYKHNDLAAGRFVALGQRIDLKRLRAPLFLLAARDDEVVAPAQLFAAERLVGTPAECLRSAEAPCRHVGLFVGKVALDEFWPGVARWLLEPGSIAPEILGADPIPARDNARSPAVSAQH